MNRFLLAILLLAIASMACNVVLAAPKSANKPVPTVQITPKTVPTVTKPLPTVRVTAYQSLHVRTARMGTRIAYLYHGDIVTLTGTCDQGWAEIQWKGATAWVNADYLSPNKCSEEQ